MIKTVLVTRPQKLAEKTAHLLCQKGYSPYILPLTQTVPLPLHEDPIGFNALIATSSAVFFHAPQQRKEQWRHYPLYCVGKTTALSAQQDGFSVAGIAPTARQLVTELKNENKTFLYLAGRVRRPILENGLADKIINSLEVYDTIKCAVDNKTMTEFPRPFNAILFYSALAAENTTSLYTLSDERTIAVCLADRIAETLPKEFKGHRVIAKTPDEDALFETLISYC